MSLLRYTIVVLGIAALTFALAWAVALRRADPPTRWAAAFGGSLAVVNTLVAHARGEAPPKPRAVVEAGGPDVDFEDEEEDD